MSSVLSKKQRIRDPLHNLIEFEVSAEFEDVMWQVLQSSPFQRLRRIKQLGFSDMVYPGASHSRFAHSVGVFHTARRLMKIVERSVDRFSETKAHQALAAALVHDLGHGPFSHAFEAVGKKTGLQIAKHESVSDTLIREGDVSSVLNQLGSGFAQDVADIVSERGEKNVYRAVVSSQFDADRLDYMQRDRLMTGAQSGAIDFEWLLANLTIRGVPEGVDEQQTGEIETFVVGPKANMAAEAFVIGLFHLYPAVYFHKATRACEKHFVELLCKLFALVADGESQKTGLSETHPLIRFAKEPKDINRALALDDAVVIGALPLLVEAEDQTIADFSRRLRERSLYKCIDLRSLVSKQAARGHQSEEEGKQKLKALCSHLTNWSEANSVDRPPRILLDEGSRLPYKSISESKGPADRINILTPEGRLSDLGERSEVVGALTPFQFSRAYIAPDDSEARAFIDKAAGERTA